MTLDSMNKKLDAIALLTTSFYLVYNNFHAIHSEDSAQDIVFAYRSDTIFNFDQDLNEEIVPNDILYRWISPFVLIQKGIIERAILFLNNQKQEISVLSSDKNNYRSRQESELPSSLHTISNNNTIEILDIRQSALLYHLLLLHGAIRPMADMNLAKLVHHLTGYSEQNLRTKDGLGVIWDIIEGKRIHVEFKDDPNHNLKAIKSLLTDMISDIDSKMVKNK